MSISLNIARSSVSLLHSEGVAVAVACGAALGGAEPSSRSNLSRSADKDSYAGVTLRDGAGVASALARNGVLVPDRTVKSRTGASIVPVSFGFVVRSRRPIRTLLAPSDR